MIMNTLWGMALASIIAKNAASPLGAALAAATSLARLFRQKQPASQKQWS
jgi:hypothetical protein